jgi:hypothetical protein
MLVIDIFKDTTFLKVRCSEAPLQGTVLLPQPLLVNQQCEAFFKSEIADFGGLQLCAERIGDSVQFHRVKLIEGLLVQHV